MAHQLIFIHGGETFPSYERYMAWLRDESTFDPLRNDRRSKRWHRQLETTLPGWEILRPQMPNDVNAQYIEWEVYFEKVIPYIKPGAVLVGHSLGGTFLLKYLAAHEIPVRLTSIHLVAPSFGLLGTSFEVTEDISSIVKRISQLTIHHSQDDMVVPFSESEHGVLQIEGAKLQQYDHKGHFLEETFTELIDAVMREVE